MNQRDKDQIGLCPFFDAGKQEGQERNAYLFLPLIVSKAFLLERDGGVGFFEANLTSHSSRHCKQNRCKLLVSFIVCSFPKDACSFCISFFPNLAQDDEGIGDSLPQVLVVNRLHVSGQLGLFLMLVLVSVVPQTLELPDCDWRALRDSCQHQWSHHSFTATAACVTIT